MSPQIKSADATCVTQADWVAFETRNGAVDYLDAVFSDMCGTLRGKRLPGSEVSKLLTSGLQIPRSLYFIDATGVNEDIQGMGFTDGDPDGTAYPVAGTLAPVPWSGGAHAQVLMTMVEKDGTPCLLEPRNVLAHVLARLEQKGLRPVVAVEFEFYLLDPNPGVSGAPLLPINPNTGARENASDVYSIDAIEAFETIMEDITAFAGQQGVPASAVVSEFAPGQYEVNLAHEANALVAADHAVMLRHLIKSTARKHGLRATFMAKPFLGEVGNGCHVHVSLSDKAGKNVFNDGSEKGAEELRWALGGLQTGLADAMAVIAPNVNSYRRFGANLFVPVNGGWGYNNRSVAFRIPAGEPGARRIEHRVAGADVNPYLLLAVILGGIDHGLNSQINPGSPADRNVSGNVDPDIPADLVTALERLERSAMWRDYLGGHYVDVYVQTKRLEHEKFQNHISSREYEWYL